LLKLERSVKVLATLGAVWVAASASIAGPVFAEGPALADEASPVEEVILLLQERGVIDESDATRIVERNRSYEKKRSWTDRISFFGDFRSRYDGIWYDEDPLGNKMSDRDRLRYRFRFGANVEVNDHFDMRFRLASAEGNDVRSRNQTLGSGFDFDPDFLHIEQAYVTFHAYGDEPIPFGGRKLDFLFGKMPNLFHSKVGKDLLLMDNDFALEGVAFTYAADPLENLGVTFTSGFFVIFENSESDDPYVVPIQLRLEAEATDQISFGTNLTGWLYRSLDSDFFARAASFGNVPGGLSSDRDVTVGDLRAWMKFTGISDWPILVYGNVANNFSAQNTTGFNAGKESLAASAGFEIGDKRKWAQLGAAYFWIQANAVPAVFTDSDLFDGTTNAKGWAIYGAKQVLANTDLKATLFLKEPLDPDIFVGDGIEGGVADSDRIRIQADVVVKF
jgi:hypothetical protein